MDRRENNEVFPQMLVRDMTKATTVPSWDRELRRLVDWYVETLPKLGGYTPTDAHQLLLCCRELELECPLVQHVARRIASVEDPPECHHEHIVESVMRQVVLMRFNVGLEDRRRFFHYWITRRNLATETPFIKAYIVGLAVEQLHQSVVEDDALEYVRSWFLRHTNLESDRMKAWVPRYLCLLGHPEEALKIASELLSQRKRNGSWGGSYDRTAAVLFALSRFPDVATLDLTESLSYLLRRLQRGLTGNIVLEATTLKAVYTLGLLPEPFHDLLSEAVERVYPFSRHFSEEIIVKLHQAVVSCRLDRDVLLGGVDAHFVAQLARNPSPSAQCLSDLHAMNEVPSLLDGTIPIRTWLTNASAMSCSRLENTVFETYLSEVNQHATGRAVQHGFAADGLLAACAAVPRTCGADGHS
ncbi:MAG: hypothetical protein IPK82_38420 [Polyangiaceae bacterium]|nr:hypothetical protein [Polyangiaceae bacterium]